MTCVWICNPSCDCGDGFHSHSHGVPEPATRAGTDESAQKQRYRGSSQLRRARPGHHHDPDSVSPFLGPDR